MVSSHRPLASRPACSPSGVRFGLFQVATRSDGWETLRHSRGRDEPGRQSTSEQNSSSRDGADDQEGLFAGSDLLRQLCVRRLSGQVFLAGEKPDHRPPFLRVAIPQRAEQSRIGLLEGVEDAPLGHWAAYMQLDDPSDARKDLQVFRKDDLDHFRVWTSTESTGGRSRTMASQLSPPSAEA